MDPVAKTTAIKHSRSIPQNHLLSFTTITYPLHTHTYAHTRLENSFILINTQSHHPANKFTFTITTFNP